jgi:hypothetical protein
VGAETEGMAGDSRPLELSLPAKASAIIRFRPPDRVEHIERHVEIPAELRVSTQQSLPGDLVTLPLALGHDPHARGTHAHHIELPAELQLTLDRLVETSGQTVLL